MKTYERTGFGKNSAAVFAGLTAAYSDRTTKPEPRGQTVVRIAKEELTNERKTGGYWKKSGRGAEKKEVSGKRKTADGRTKSMLKVTDVGGLGRVHPFLPKIIFKRLPKLY